MDYWCDERLTVMQTGPEGTSEFALDRPFARIGSHPDCDIVLPDPQIARRALYLHALPEGIYCLDLDLVEGSPEPHGRWLVPGESLSLGDFELTARLASGDGQASNVPAVDLAARGSAQPPLPVVNIYSGKLLKDKRRFRSQLTVVGRRPQCSLQLRGYKVSGFHCALFWHERRLWCIDLGSSNGTLLNGERIECREVERNDRLDVGEFRLVYYRWSPRNWSDQQASPDTWMAPAGADQRALSQSGEIDPPAHSGTLKLEDLDEAAEPSRSAAAAALAAEAERRAAAEAAHAAAEDERKRAEAARMEAEAAQAAANADRERLEAALAEAERRREEAEARHAQVETECEQLTAELARLRHEADARYRANDEAARETGVQHEQVLAELETLRRERGARQQETESLQAQAHDLAAVRQRLEQELAQRDTRIAELERLRAEQLEATTRLQARETALEAQLREALAAEQPPPEAAAISAPPLAEPEEKHADVPPEGAAEAESIAELALEALEDSGAAASLPLLEQPELLMESLPHEEEVQRPAEPTEVAEQSAEDELLLSNEMPADEVDAASEALPPQAASEDLEELALDALEFDEPPASPRSLDENSSHDAPVSPVQLPAAAPIASANPAAPDDLEDAAEFALPPSTDELEQTPAETEQAAPNFSFLTDSTRTEKSVGNSSQLPFEEAAPVLVESPRPMGRRSRAPTTEMTSYVSDRLVNMDSKRRRRRVLVWSGLAAAIAVATGAAGAAAWYFLK